MKVLLVEINPYVPISLPISLGYLAAVLQREGHRAEILNVGEGTDLSPRSFLGLLEEVRPQLVGFSIYQRNILHVKGLARAVKEFDPSIRVILGGPQATFMPSEALSVLPHIDFLCRGEGEVVILHVVRTLEEGSLDRPVPGTLTRLAADLWEEGPPVEAPQDLDAYPSPFLEDLFDLEGLEEAILLTSRGCPYSCIFCYTPRAFGRSIRYHSIERVCEEMTWLNRRGIDRFWLADPSFSFHRERTERLLERLLHRRIRGRIWLETRADLMDEDLARLMTRAGVRQVAFGLESASERVLRGLGKGISLSHIERAVRTALRHGMEVELFSQYGLPGERFEDAMATLRFVKRCVPIKGNTNAQQMRLYFGTPLQERHRRFGIHPLEEKRPPYLSIGVRYETEWMKVEEIHRIRDLWRSASLDGGKRLVS
jgi:radical SAM superfamily enzyme YgiQ (UPF0313 family)